MFDYHVEIGLLAGEFAEDEWVFQLTQTELAAEWAEPNRQVLPEGLEDWEPGVLLAAIASSVDRTRLNGHDAVRLMQAEARLASHFEAGKLATMVEVAHSPGGGRDARVERDVSAVEYASDEIAAALSQTRRAADNDLELALTLTGGLRQVWDRFRGGSIDLRRVRVLHQQLGHLGGETVKQISDRILDDAGDLTTGQLRARLARLVMEVDPEGVDVGYEKGLADRKFVTYANPDHTATVAGCSIAPARAAAISSKVNRIAKSRKTASDPRTMDQIRADVFVDLLLGKGPRLRNARGGVHLKADVATLAELSNAPGELAGFGPVIADITRQTAAAMIGDEWTFTVTDGDGEIITTGITRRRPTAAQRRHVEAEHETCVFVGCRMPAYDCDLDHRRPFAGGGPTHNANLGPLCRHHHMAKHHAPWLQHRRPGGDHVWTSPLGHSYVVARARPP